MKKLTVYFLVIALTVTSSLGAGIYFLRQETTSSNSPDIKIIFSSYDREENSVYLKIRIISDRSIEVSTSTSELFTIDVLGEEGDMWTVGNLAATVVTTHVIDAGITYWDYTGSVFQKHPTFAPIDPPNSLTIVVKIGEEYKSSPYTLNLV